MLNTQIGKLKGSIIRAFLKNRYQVTPRPQLTRGSEIAVTVARIGTPRKYRVTFQFVNLSIFGYANQYRAYQCTCPRFAERGDCHHVLVAIDDHAEQRGDQLPNETFAAFEMSKANRTELLKAVA